MREKLHLRATRTVQSWIRGRVSRHDVRSRVRALELESTGAAQRVARGYLARFSLRTQMRLKTTFKQLLLPRSHMHSAYTQTATNELRLQRGGGDRSILPKQLRDPKKHGRVEWLYPDSAARHIQSACRSSTVKQDFSVAVLKWRRVQLIVRCWATKVLKVVRSRIASTHKLQGWWGHLSRRWNLRNVVSKAQVLHFRQQVGATAMRFLFRMLHRMRVRQKLLQEAQAAAKSRICEVERCYNVQSLWLGISRTHAAWHPWDARYRFHNLILRHRVLIRALYLQYSMRGLRIPEKAFRVSIAQCQRFIQDCKFSNEAIQAAPDKAMVANAPADAKACHGFLQQMLEALKATTAEIKDRAARSGWCLVRSSVGADRANTLGIDAESTISEDGDEGEGKTLGLAEFLELITRVALVAYRNREGDTSMNHPADCLEAFIDDKFEDLSISDDGGRSLLEIRGGTRPAKKAPGPYEEDQERSLEILGNYKKRLKALYDSVVTRKFVKTKTGKNAIRQDTSPQMTIADFMRTVTAAKVLGEQLTVAAICHIYILSNREEVHTFINFSPASDFGLMEMNFDEFNHALVAMAVKKFFEKKKASAFHFHSVLETLIGDILAAHQLSSAHALNT